MYKLFVVQNCLVSSLCYTSIPGTALLLFGAKLKANCPLFIPHTIDQAAPPAALGSATADEQFK